jgi:hypothetical protein
MYSDDSLPDKLFSAFVYVGLPAICVAIVIGGPIASWYSAGVEQKAINSQCGTNYSQLDVLLSSKSLTELCRIKNQQLTVNQK